jgi:putative ABC transport system permease protein
MEKTKNTLLPPLWAQRLLKWYCKPSLHEDLEGDLNEYFARNVMSKGAFRARLIYTLDVLKFFRPYTIRKFDFINAIIHWIMIASYIKTSGRNIVRNKLFSFINIVGLSISMTVALLLISMINDLYQYDRFHEHYDNIYRVISQHQYKGSKGDDFFATTSLRAATEIKSSITGVQDVAIIQNWFEGDVSQAEVAVPLGGYWANESFFQVFSFALKQGNMTTALKEPFSMVLTEKSALKLFGDTNVLGKIVKVSNDREYTITGIMQDIPDFSHIKFDMLGSLSTYELVTKNIKEDMRWNNIWSTYVYMRLTPEQDADRLRQNLANLSRQHDNLIPDVHIELDIQPLSTIMVGPKLSNQIGAVMGEITVLIFSGLCLVVLLSACFNYTNLSIARSFSRSREIGIRKTVGALKSHVVMQFMVESIILSLLALALAFPLFLLIKPHFISIEPSLQQLLRLDLSVGLVLMFIAFAVAVGVFAGFFPALFFAKLNAIQVLKSVSAIPGLKGLTMRKGLIVFQYCISIIAITTTLIFYKQYKHFVSYDLGFNTENILNIRLHGNKASQLKKELEELPEVQGISQSMMIPSIGNYWGATMKTDASHDSINIYYNMIDEHYLPLHGHTLLAGRNFKPRYDTLPESEIIINEDVLKQLHLPGNDPSKAIDQVVKVDGVEMRVIGVMKTFQYGRANNKTDNNVIMRQAREADYMNVKILSSDWPATYAKIEAIWKKFDTVHPLEAKFYDEQIEEAFKGLNAAMKVGGFLATLVICIASIGLFGMVVFTTQTRLKEISIRKVLGASEGGLLYLLSRGFLILLIVAASIAIPITYFFFDSFLLPQIANHSPIAFMDIFIGVLVVMIVALLMIGSQTFKVSRTNPAEVLKTE